MPAEFPGRSPSAPPQETVDDKFVEALMHGIREEQSDALFVGSGSFQEPKALKVVRFHGDVSWSSLLIYIRCALSTPRALVLAGQPDGRNATQ